MEYLSLVILLVGFLATLYALDRRDRRERDERAELLTRIQAPEVAVFDNDQMDTEIMAIEFDNDREFAEMRRDAAAE